MVPATVGGGGLIKGIPNSKPRRIINTANVVTRTGEARRNILRALVPSMDPLILNAINAGQVPNPNNAMNNAPCHTVPNAIP